MAGPLRLLAAAAGVVLVAGLGACGDDDDAGGDAATEEAGDAATEETGDASVAIAEPGDGATLPSPVVVKMTATNFTIEPAGDGTVTEGHGHFHVMVDVDCVAPGTVIPSDANHNHFGKAQTEASLELAPGEHTICLQAGDGAHTALDLTDQITVTVQ